MSKIFGIKGGTKLSGKSIDSYSEPAHTEQAKDDGYLPCNYGPQLDDYCRALVRPQDFIEKQPRKKADGTRGPSTTVIKRPGEAVYDSANEYWTFRTLDVVEGELVKGEWFKVRYENIDFS